MQSVILPSWLLTGDSAKLIVDWWFSQVDYWLVILPSWLLTGESAKLIGDRWVLFREAKLFRRQNVILMNKRIQAVGYTSF